VHCESVGRLVHIINLDPAAEHFDFPVAADIRDLISLEVRPLRCCRWFALYGVQSGQQWRGRA
jgi:hypothetical protein